MRITAKLYSNVKGRILKEKWRNLIFVDKALKVPNPLIERGIKVIDPLVENEEKREKWEPPVGDDRWYKPPPPEENVNYHEEPAYVFSHGIRMTEGRKQACALTKSLMYSGMPKPVEDFMYRVNKYRIPEKTLLIQRYIMQSQKWDTTKKKLTKRIDKSKLRWHFQREFGIPIEKSAEILLHNLARLCQSVSYKNPRAIQERRMILKPYVEANYKFKDGKSVIVKGINDILVSSSRPLPAFAGEDMIDQSTQEELLNMYPILPTIDLSKDNIYTLDNDTGFRNDYQKSHVHTFLYINRDYWRDEQRQGRALMYCAAYALAQAKFRYGEDVQRLPEPVCVQCINADENTFNFTFFQLNTVDFDTDTGVKNMAWFDTGNKLFEKRLSRPWNPGKQNKTSKLFNYDTHVFKKFMTVMLYGSPSPGKKPKKEIEEK